MGEGSDGAEGAAFAHNLSALKERGSSILVVGTTYDRGHVAVCDRLLGETDVRRRRLLVRTDGDCGAAPADDDAETRVVEQPPPPNGESEGVAGQHRRTVPGGDIGALERAALEEFESMAAATGEPEPGELRVCVDSLRPLFVEHADDRVRAFVGELGDRVSAAKGMAHFHLPAGSDDRHLEVLTPVVDAVVEVATVDGDPRQRWHVLDGTVDSGWLPL